MKVLVLLFTGVLGFGLSWALSYLLVSIRTSLLLRREANALAYSLSQRLEYVKPAKAEANHYRVFLRSKQLRSTYRPRVMPRKPLEGYRGIDLFKVSRERDGFACPVA